MKVKICGITRLEDALQAVEAGADLIGYNFYPPSPRCISLTKCERIQAGLQGRGIDILTVGVFVNAPPSEVASVLDGCGLDLAQLHGGESLQDLKVLGERAFKALRPASRLEAQAQYMRLPARQEPPAALIDAYKPGQFGGTGQTGDWGIALTLSARAPILLAGGLTPLNVAESIRQVHPWGVDVASGVESEPGQKDAGKVLAFIQAAHQAAEEIILEVHRND